MSKPRSHGQKQVIIMMKQEFVDEIDEHATNMGLDRSSFIRNAVYDEMVRAGIDINASLKSAPSRKGKGGPKKKATTLSKDHDNPELKVAEGEANYEAKKKTKNKN